MKTLEQVLSYENPRVIDKFREDYYFDRDEAGDIFKQMLTWLWLAASTGEDHMCSMYHPMLVMDKMWHTFLSFSKDYSGFCNDSFGKFIHHEPHTRGDAVKRLTPTATDAEPFATISQEIGNFQSHVFDTLGADTLIKWFVTFPHVYSPEEIQRRSRPQFSQRGFLMAAEMRAMEKKDLMTELAKTHAIAAYCGGPSCGMMCAE